MADGADVHVKHILVTLVTGNREGADTNGDVFLGLGGREFNLRRTADLGPDRRRGATEEYSLGVGANIANTARNDPRTDLKLKADQLEGLFPVFIRFKGQTDTDTWNLEAATVEVTSDLGTQKWRRMAGTADNLWLGTQFGNVCYLDQIDFLFAG